MKEYFLLIEKLQEIKEKGYIKTHRKGNTGIGKTLEIF
ncbi:MAG TPA: MvaI/BcnI family restriction endonuclease [bacterium]|nr:MvaI/BcnI family restriction endonuclease [bacterium]